MYNTTTTNANDFYTNKLDTIITTTNAIQKHYYKTLLYIIDTEHYRYHYQQECSIAKPLLIIHRLMNLPK